ncbi:GNAT family N-acetyltransferase [Streptomyces virginiae]|uniref:GNAT family N-acetyltransferase n=1 Tax=Streptomyces virginiae TaxID=1961 RepID=UPI0036A407ED
MGHEPVPVDVEVLDGAAAGEAEGEFRSVYAEAFGEPPYNEGEGEVEAAFRRFRAQSRRAGFRGSLARGSDGRTVGIGYGFPLGPQAVWWDELTEPVPEEMRREDGRRTFGLMELAVRAPWRGQGISRRLHDGLLDGVGVERVLLNVHPASVAAVAAYRAWGYRKVGEARPGGGVDLFDVMLLDLR